jgi:hypothetical protein
VGACAEDLLAGHAYLFEAERPVMTLAFPELCAAVGKLLQGTGEERS